MGRFGVIWKENECMRGIDCKIQGAQEIWDGMIPLAFFVLLEINIFMSNAPTKLTSLQARFYPPFITRCQLHPFVLESNPLPDSSSLLFSPFNT